jgi:hypothetical protein
VPARESQVVDPQIDRPSVGPSDEVDAGDGALVGRDFFEADPVKAPTFR